MELTKQQRLLINYKVLALKHQCTENYIGKVLRGERMENSEKAKAICEEVKGTLKEVDSIIAKNNQSN